MSHIQTRKLTFGLKCDQQFFY